MFSNEHLEQWDRLTCEVVRVQTPDAMSQRIIRTGSYPNSAIIILVLQTCLEIQTRVVVASHGFLISPQTSVVELCPIERSSSGTSQPKPPTELSRKWACQEFDASTLQPHSDLTRAASQGQGLKELTLQRGVDRLQRHRGPETSRRRAFFNVTTR